MKLDRPPSVANWVRNNRQSEAATVRTLIRFERGKPIKSYAAGNKIVQDALILGLDEETALSSAMTKGRSNSRDLNYEYVSAFYKSREDLGLLGLPAYQEFVSPFRISRALSVPVQPTAVLRTPDYLLPIFCFGWQSIPLTLFQQRLMMTVLEDAVFSLTDFLHSPAKVCFFPKLSSNDGSEAARRAVVWERGDFELLPHNELRHQTDMYARALAEAKRLIAEEKNADQQQRQPRQPPQQDPSQLPLFR